MADPFSAVLDEEEARLRGENRAAVTNYDSVLQDEVQQRQSQLGASLRQSVAVKPDAVAQHKALANATGIPQGVVERNADFVAQQARVKQLQDLASTSPVLARQLADPEFAKIAHDDAEGLSTLEQLFGYVKKGSAALGASLPRANAGLWGVAQAGAELTSKYITGPLAGTLLPADPAAIAAEKFRSYRRDQAGFAKDIKRDGAGAGFVEQAIYSGITSLGQNLLTLPLALATGNPNMALVPMSAQTGGEAYGQARDKGKELLTSLQFATSQAVIEYATEKLPVSRLLGDLKVGTPFWKLVLKQAAVEIPGEQLATVLQDLNEWAVLKPEAPFSEYLAERPSAAAQTLIATVVSVGGQTTVAKGIEMAANKMGAGLERAAQAEQSQQLWLQLEQLAAASKLRERAPDSFGEFVQSAAEDGPVTDVYVSGIVLADTLQQSGIPIPASVAAQLPEAIATGGDVKIPIGEYTAQIAASDAGKALLEHLKTSPEAMSFAESQVFYQEQAAQFKEQADQILAEQQGNLELQQQAEAVKQHFAQQLGQANRFTPQVNDAYATLMQSFYVTTAQRLGITPVEMLARYPLRIAAENVANENQMDQRTPEFQSWFAGSKVVDAEGQPLRVYHSSQNDIAEFREGSHFGSLEQAQSRAESMRIVRETEAEKAGQAPAQATDTYYPAYLSLKNPKRVKDVGIGPNWDREIRQAKAEGHDGLVYDNEAEGGGDSYVIFDPNQIKSVFNERPTDSPNILEQPPQSDIGHKREKESGRYVGAPDWVGNSPQALAALRAKLRQLAREGEPGRHWYENSSKAILDMVGGDKVEAEKLVALIAIYSPNATVPANTSMALTAYYQFQAGREIKAGFGDSNRKALRALTTGERWSGIKTNSFYQNLMQEIDPSKNEAQNATMDMWMAIAFDYGVKTVDQGPKYMFMQRETQRLAAELGWAPHQAQAAIWVAMKGRVDQIRPELLKRDLKAGNVVAVVKDGETTHKIVKRYEHYRLAHKLGMAYDLTVDDVLKSKYDFANAIEQRLAQISWEATPGQTSGLLPGMLKAPLEQKQEYLVAVIKALTDENGEDLLAQAVGLPQGTTLQGFSAWNGDIGAGAQTFIAVPSEGAGKKRAVKKAPRALLNQYAALKGFVMGQDAVVWHQPVYDDSQIRHNGVDVLASRALTADEMRVLYDALHAKFGTWDLAPGYTATGARILNFVDGLDNKKFQAGVREVIDALPDDFGGGAVETMGYRSDGEYIGNNWQENRNGEAYREILATGRPDLLERAERLRARVAAVNERFGEKYGWDKQRPVVYEQSARVEGRDRGLAEAQARAKKAAGPEVSLVGLPDAPLRVEGEWYVPGPSHVVHEVARSYMARAGLPYNPITTFRPVDTARAERIAAEYDRMAHAPTDPTVKAAYDAMIAETIEQYREIIGTGLVVEFIDYATQGDPYASSPRAAITDVLENNHLWVFPTSAGFGSDATFDPSANPLLQETEFLISGRKAVANDLFRVVHDYFGHIKDGVGFRANGEENAWRSHSAMYSPLARRAMTSETRGQNSWVNFGPHGGANRTASAADTVYADQKTGLMPEWVSTDGAEDALEQGTGSARGQISFGNDIRQGAVLQLLQNADLSTFLHESGHFFLEVMVDIATSPDAPAQIVADTTAVMKWFGVKDVAVWKQMTLGQKRGHHEKFARGFEAYLFEGKSPNVELGSLFSRFRAWMINVYKSLTSLNVELTDEVRSVFDRLLATDEAIASAEGLRSMVPMFASAQEAAATAAEWQAYQELGGEARDKAVQQLQRRSLADLKWAQNARGRYIKALQAEANDKRAAIAKEVAAEVEQEPLYAAMRWLKTGVLPTGEKTVGAKLSMAALKEMYGDAPAAPWRYIATNMVTADLGLHPNVVAEMFGLSSGDELVRKIVAADPMHTVIEGMTDQRMLERYGDLVDERAIAQAADEAVHNDARARFVATELRFLDRVSRAQQPTGNKTGSVNVLTKAAKDFAEQLIARKAVRELRPAQYIAAETRAAKAAMLAKNPREKAVEKRNQLVNLHAARAAQKAQAEIEKALRYLRKAGDSDTIDPDYRDQIYQLLERFDLRQASRAQIEKRAALRDWVEEQRELGFEPVIDKALLAEAQRQHYSTLSVEEFRGLVDAVKNIEHLGRLKTKLLTAKDEREFAERVAEATKSVHDNATGTVQERKSSDRGPLVALGRLFRGFTAEHRKFSSLVREMDGFKDGGVLWELFSRTMNEAGDREASARESATIELTKLLKPILAGDALGKKVYIPAVDKSFTREERLGIALNVGNEINRERVLTGERWSPAQLESVLDTLTKDEWDFVQSVWNYLESYRPQIAEKQRRVTGVEPEWVDPRQVVTKHGVYKGGYYPIKYDPLLDSKSEADDAAMVQRQMERGLYVRAQTRRGHLEARSESTGRRMRYDLGVIMSHVDQVIHDLSWHEWLIDANRLLRAKSLDGTIREHYGPEKLAQLKNALRDIAIGELPAQNSWERILGHLRHGATIVGLGWNVTTSLLQPFGLTQSMVRIGAGHVARGLGRWVTDPEKGMEWIYERSSFMRLRGKTMQREINEIRNTVSGRSSAIEASYFWLIQTMQKVADVPTWLGAYEKAMSEADMTEERAVALADQAVIDAQGSGQIKDLAAIQRGGQALKLWTNFYSFFNTTYNLAVERTKATKFSDPLQVAKLAIDYLLLFIVPATLGAVLKEALKWDGDEDELAKKLIRENLNYLFGLMIGMREMSAAIQGFQGYGGPGGTRFFTETAKLVKQVGQGEVDEAAVKAAANTAGVILHLPTGQVTRTLDGIDALVRGKTANPGALIAGSQKN